MPPHAWRRRLFPPPIQCDGPRPGIIERPLHEEAEPNARDGICIRQAMPIALLGHPQIVSDSAVSRIQAKPEKPAVAASLCNNYTCTKAGRAFMFIFITAVRHPKTSASYERVESLLNRTLSSVCNQTDGEFRVIVVCAIKFRRPVLRMRASAIWLQRSSPLRQTICSFELD